MQCMKRFIRVDHVLNIQWNKHMNVADRILAFVVCNKLISKAVTMFSYFDRLQHYVSELAVHAAG